MSRRTQKGYDRAISEMDKLGSFLEVPHEVRQMAKELFLSLAKEKFTYGRPVFAVAFVCLLFMIKQDPSCQAISFTEFQSAIPQYPGIMISPRDIRRVYNLLGKKFGVPSQKCSIRPKIYVESIGKKLNLRETVLQEAIQISEEVLEKKFRIGRSPITIAAACLCAARFLARKRGEEDKSICKIRREIAEKTAITEMSIAKTLKLPFFQEKLGLAP